MNNTLHQTPVNHAYISRFYDKEWGKSKHYTILIDNTQANISDISQTVITTVCAKDRSYQKILYLYHS